MGNLGQADFGVPHSRCVVAVHRAEISLSVHQHVPHGEVLRHPNDGVVDRLVTVWVVFTNHVTHDTRRLFVRSVPVVVQLVHGEQHAAVNRLQSVPRIGQGASYDHAHGVIEVAAPHLLFKTNGQGFFGELGHGAILAMSGTTPDSTARQM